MQLTTHTDYSLRLLIYLAIRDGGMQPTVQAVAEHYGISANHVAKVAQTLVQYGYISSQRGRGGGLTLAKPASQINVGDVVRHTENLRLLECFGPNSTCPIDPGCTLKTILGRAQAAFLEVLDAYSLDALVTNDKELRALLTGA